jgi:hypothetical protein
MENDSRSENHIKITTLNYVIFMLCLGFYWKVKEEIGPNLLFP